MGKRKNSAKKAQGLMLDPAQSAALSLSPSSSAASPPWPSPDSDPSSTGSSHPNHAFAIDTSDYSSLPARSEHLQSAGEDEPLMLAGDHDSPPAVADGTYSDADGHATDISGSPVDSSLSAHGAEAFDRVDYDGSDHDSLVQRPPVPRCAIFWDFENCTSPTNVPGHVAVEQLRKAVAPYGPITQFRAYQEITETSNKQLRSELQASGISVVDTPHNFRKDAADKMMIVDMLIYAMDNPPPSTIVVLSGDRDFAYALAVLRNRQYNIVLIVPHLPSCHSVLKAQADVVLEWRTDVLTKELVSAYQKLKDDSLHRVSSLARSTSQMLANGGTIESLVTGSSGIVAGGSSDYVGGYAGYGLSRTGSVSSNISGMGGGGSGAISVNGSAHNIQQSTPAAVHVSAPSTNLRMQVVQKQYASASSGQHGSGNGNGGVGTHSNRSSVAGIHQRSSTFSAYNNASTSSSTHSIGNTTAVNANSVSGSSGGGHHHRSFTDTPVTRVHYNRRLSHASQGSSSDGEHDHLGGRPGALQGFFDLLLDVLRAWKAEGVTKPNKARVVAQIRSRSPMALNNHFGGDLVDEYLEAAATSGIVRIGGFGAGEWITINDGNGSSTIAGINGGYTVV